ncbi:MAG: photosynthetic reaction center subunit H [Pseudomonadota bacterium]
MLSGEFIPGIDLVDIFLWLFTLFFVGLVLYLQREGMREGFPTELDTSGKQDTSSYFFPPQPKTFKQPHGRDDVVIGFAPGDTRKPPLKRTAVWPGSPFEPAGDPLVDGVGPASYAERADYPDLTHEGAPRIAPYRVSPGYTVAEGDHDPRTLPVYGFDGKKAGEVTDLWVDRSESIIRYYEVAVDLADGGKKTVLLPVPFANLVTHRKPRIEVHAMNAADFAKAPTTKDADSVTRLEEDKICGFFGGGLLYSGKKRTEPLL